MIRMRNILASVLVLAGLALVAGCENEQQLAGGGDASVSADVSYGGGDGGDGCMPCPDGHTGPYGTTCCPLKQGSEPFDPCFGSCGAGTVCNKATQKCVGCDDGNPCTDNGVDAATKACVYTNNTAACDDNNKCTTGDKCSVGVCVGGTPLDCTDGNACTIDTCVPATGCVHTPNDFNCDDGNVCMGGEKCVNGACVAGTPLSGGGCDDSNVGTTGDICVAGVCKGSVIACNDNNKCTMDSGGNPCVYTPVACNDNNACTDDSCNPATGCGYVNNTAACTDNNACTTSDKCGGGVCLAGTPTNCDDNNPCTTDSCDSVTGCAHVNNTAACSDNNACTTSDKCGGGTCAGGAALVCDDGNPCTSDSCNPVIGCVNAVVAGCSLTGEVCGDGIDNDGDGKKDCEDEECNGVSNGYVLHAFAAGGGTISFASAGIPGGLELQLPAQSPGPDGQLGTADDLGPQYFIFACSEIPFAAKISGAGQVVAWVTSVTYPVVGGKPDYDKPVFGGPPPASWLPAFWWPWNGAVAHPATAPAVTGQASFQVNDGTSFLVRWPPQ